MDKATEDALNEAERRLRAQLADLQREFQARAKPIIHQLAEIEALRPPVFYVTPEQAKAWGLIS